MTAPPRSGFWTRPRLFALATTFAVVAVFAAANAHLIYVSFASQPDCVLSSSETGTASYRAAKPSC
ncbi:MAG: hypothetical protein ACK5MQ_10140 [Pikeienuella sp.]